jgi:predicted ABC-type ATPase
MPTLILFAGPNGSGKSTITREYQQKPGFPLRYINADEIVKGTTTGTQEEREIAAFRTARTLRQTYREQGESFAFETVFSHPSTLLDIRNCRVAGFQVHVVFVTTQNVEINIQRVRGRVQQGGHDVPEDKIRSRYARSLALLPRIAEEADYLDVFDNSGSNPMLCFQRTYLGEKWRDDLPVFWEHQFRIPLQERADEQLALGAISTPNEATEMYDGVIISVGRWYMVQKTAMGLVRHDRLLLLGEVREGERYKIAYKDMQGTITKA